MRLHQMRFEAIGPFAAAQCVDFDLLGAGGMFLLEGPTGVGKTTVLEALTFALYGHGPQSETDPGRLHSQYAEPGQQPRVELEFSVGECRYRIARTPRHLRAKRRGSGTVAVQPGVMLSRGQLGEWVELTHDNAEAGSIVSGLLGLNRDQFRQVVALPQGQFARFLKADDDDRRVLLTRLFGTQLFDRITAEVEVRARDARTAQSQSEGRLATRLAAALEAGGIVGGAAEALGQLDPDTACAVLDVHEGELASLLSRHLRRERAAGRAVRKMAAAAESAGELAARMIRLVGLCEATERHSLGRPARDLAAAELSQAQRAEPLAPLLAKIDAAGRGVCAASEAVTAAVAAAVPLVVALGGQGDGKLPGIPGVTPAGQVPPDVAGALPEDLVAAVIALRARAAALGGLAELASGLADRRTHLASLRAQRSACEKAASAAALEAGQLRELLTSLGHAISAAAQQAGDGATLALELSQWRERAGHAARAEDLGHELARAEVAREAAVDEHQLQVDRYQELQEQRIAGMRAELAGMLVAGQPCAVCGSDEHPDPATSQAPQVTAADCRGAARRRDGALQVRLQAEQLVHALHAQVAQATGGAAGATPQEALARIADLSSRLAAAEDAQRIFADLTCLRERWQADIAALGSQAAEHAVTGSALAATEAVLGVELTADTRREAAGRCGHASVADHIGALEAAARALDDLLSARRGLEQADSRLAELSAVATTQLASVGFDDLPAVSCALRPASRTAELERLVRDWDREEQHLAGQLQAVDLAALDPLDLEQCQKAHESAVADLARVQEFAGQARAEVVAAQRTHCRFSECLTRYKSAVAEHGEFVAGTAELIELDRMVRGLDPRKRMTLTTYVLRYWFNQVVAAANLRLAVMSAGKYELVRVESADSKRDRVGLGLAVLDRHTGRERGTGSLSGGETFYTSLALALGLSDVVAAQAGGAALETLFIDEGFGSLDSETLDEVMCVIDELRGNGRVVGIVSHVAELKERVSERLEVRRVRSDGPSTVRVVA